MEMDSTSNSKTYLSSCVNQNGSQIDCDGMLAQMGTPGLALLCAVIRFVAVFSILPQGPKGPKRPGAKDGGALGSQRPGPKGPGTQPHSSGSGPWAQKPALWPKGTYLGPQWPESRRISKSSSESVCPKGLWPPNPTWAS